MIQGEQDPGQKAPKRLRELLGYCSLAASWFVMLVAIAVLAGWKLDIEILKTVLPGQVTMKTNTALGFFMAGWCLWLLRRARVAGCPSRFAIVLAWLVLLIGLLSLGEYLTHWNPGIDQVLFHEPPGAQGTGDPNRMSQATALSFTGLGTALILMSLDLRRPRIVDLVVLPVLLIAWSSITGFVLGVDALHDLSQYTRMALPTALSFLALGLGIMLEIPDSEIVAIALGNSPGSRLFWRLLPIFIFAPLGLGWLILKGVNSTYFAFPNGIALLVLAITTIAFTWTWRMAIVLNREDTARRQAAAELSRRYFELALSHERLQELDRLKDIFLSTISHEIKTPLSIIQGYSELLEDQHPHDELVEGIQAGTHRLSVQIGRIIDYSAMLSGSLPLHMSEVDLAEVIQFVQASVEADFEQTNLQLETRIDPATPPVVADFRRLVQVLFELLDNAKKFSEPGGKVGVTLSPLNGQVRIDVWDTGKGISDGEVQRIWDPFYKSEVGDAVRTGGLGLGLTIVKRLVEMHGGTVAVKSEPGKGSCFSIYLPASPVRKEPS